MVADEPGASPDASAIVIAEGAGGRSTEEEMGVTHQASQRSVSAFWSSWASPLQYLAQGLQSMLSGLPEATASATLVLASGVADLPLADGARCSTHKGDAPREERTEPTLAQGALVEQPTLANSMALAHLGLFGDACTHLGRVVSEVGALTELHRMAMTQDPETLKVVNSDMSGRNVSMNAGSMGAQADRLGISRCKLRSVRSMHACATVLVQSHDLQRIMRAVKADTERAGGCLITFTTFARYDETPMKMAVVDSDVLFGLPPELLDTHALSRESMAYLKQAVRDSAPAKLLQTEFLFTSLVRLADRFILLAFRAVAPVQAMAKTTASVYYAASLKLESIFALGDIATEYSRVQRASCTDGDGAIARAERARAETFPREANLRTTCVLHKLCAAREGVCDLAPLVVRQVKHVVLSLRFGGHMKAFRVALRRVLLGRLQIVRGARPSPSTLQRNRARLSAFLPDTANNRPRRLTILTLCTGDWSSSGKITCHAGPTDTDDVVKSKFIGPLVAALVGQGPTSFPSRNFVRCEESLLWIGALEVVHGLFSAAYQGFCASLESAHHGGGAKAQARPNGVACAQRVPPFGLLPLAGEGGFEEGNMVEAPTVEEPSMPPASAGDVANGDVWAERQKEQHRFRATAGAWARSGTVLRDMLVMVGVLRPHVALMASEMYLCGDAFEQKEQVRVIRMGSDPGDGGVERNATDGQRQMRLPCAFAGARTETFLRDTASLTEAADQWSLLPLEFRTQSLRSMTFVLLARGIALIHRLQEARRNYPHKLLALAAQPGMLAEVQEDAACPKRLDPWSRAFVDHYGDIGSPEAIADLTSTALYAREETLSIERQHSRLRRYITGKAVQSRCVDLNGLNQHWVASFFEGRAHGSSRGSPPNPPEPRTSPLASEHECPPEERPAKRARKISAWNVFWAEHIASAAASGAKKPTASEVSQVFKQLSPEEKVRLGAKAARANEAVAAGNKRPLQGEAPSSLASGTTRLAIGGAWPAPSESDDLALAFALGADSDMWGRLRRAVQGRRRQRQDELSVAEAERQAIATFHSESGDGQRIVSEALVMVGEQSLVEHRAAFSAQPQWKPDLAVLEWSGANARCRAASAISGRSKASAGAKHPDKVGLLHRSVNAVWGLVMQPIQHVEVPAVASSSADPLPLQARLCHSANRCICGASGKAYQSIFAGISKAIKAECSPASGRKAQLLGGQIVVLLGSGFPAVGAEADGTLAAKWLLLAHCSQKPFEASFVELVPRGGPGAMPLLRRRPDALGLLALEDALALKFAGTALTHWEATLQVDKRLRCEAAFFEVVLTEGIEGHFAPDGVDVRLLPGSSLHVVWDPCKKQARATSRKARHADWDLIAVDSDEDDRYARGDDPDDHEAASCGEQEQRDDAAVPDSGGDEGQTTDSGSASAPPSDLEAEELLEGDGGEPAAGGLASEADSLLPPAPPAPPVVDAARQKRIVVRVEPFGEIVWYNTSPTRQEFYAHCLDPAHIKQPGDLDFDAPDNLKPTCCRKTRSAKAGKDTWRGRPLGFLVAWLRQQSEAVDSYGHIHLHAPLSLEERRDARAWLHGVPGAEQLFQRERPRRDEEEDEPIIFY